MDVSIIIPTMNEEETIGERIRKAKKVLNIFRIIKIII